jgi:hypothetical protein
MGPLNWLRGWPFRKPLSPRTRRRKPGRKNRFGKLAFDILEDRILLSTVRWINPNGGNWDVAANWSGGVLPGPTDDVVITPGAAATVTIQSGDTISAHSLTTGGNATLSITGGSLTIAANSTLAGTLTMTGGTLTATGSGVMVSASGTATVSAANLYAQNGATLSLPNLTGYTGTTAATTTLEATGAGSTLSLAGVTSLTQPGSGSATYVEALAGGSVNLSAVQTIDTGPVRLVSDGAGSVLNLAQLSSLTGTTNVNTWDSWLQLTNGGSLTNAGVLTGLTNVELTVSGSTENVTLSGVTTFVGGNMWVSGGATLSMPNLAGYTGSSVGPTLEATGTGSTLALTGLTSITQPGNNQNVTNYRGTGGGHGEPQRPANDQYRWSAAGQRRRRQQAQSRATGQFHRHQQYEWLGFMASRHQRRLGERRRPGQLDRR